MKRHAPLAAKSNAAFVPEAVYDVPRSSPNILVNRKILKIHLYIIDLILQSGGQWWFLGLIN